jgi:hypothetical protein
MKFALIILFVSAAALADAGNSGYDRPNRSRRSHRGSNESPFVNENIHWTLADWLVEKRMIREEDEWLALHSSSTSLALSISGAQESYILSSGGTNSHYWQNSASASLSYAILGLEYKYENSNENYVRQSGQVDLRLFGGHPRTTFLKLSYGGRQWDFASPSSHVINPYAAGYLNLYIFRLLGVWGSYQYLFNAYDQNQQLYQGDRWEYGAFIDLRFIKAFAREFMEYTRTTPSGGTMTTSIRSGYGLGGEITF